jgi:hypothetical protein
LLGRNEKSTFTQFIAVHKIKKTQDVVASIKPSNFTVLIASLYFCTGRKKLHPSHRIFVFLHREKKFHPSHRIFVFLHREKKIAPSQEIL